MQESNSVKGKVLKQDQVEQEEKKVNSAQETGKQVLVR